MEISSLDLTTPVLVTIVCGLFIFSSILRIKNAREKLSGKVQSTKSNLLLKLDIVFSGILLVWFIILFIVFIVNYGR
jgi:hypothetical protein